jgi:hypothetical protein
MAKRPTAYSRPLLILRVKPAVRLQVAWVKDANVGLIPRSNFIDYNARLRQPGLGQAFSDALKITRILVRQHARALRQREFGIHLK